MDASPTTSKSSKDIKICLSCPAALICLQSQRVSVGQCAKCGNFIAYFNVFNESRMLRMIIPDCITPVQKIYSCRDCANAYDEYDETDDE